MMDVSSTDELKLHVGCGRTRIDGWVNADLYPTEATDMCFDLERRWPIESDCLTAVYGSHVLEHLRDYETFFREAWRTVRENHAVVLRLPYGGHRSAWWDMEHIRPWYSENFCFLQPGYAQAIGNPQHDAWAYPYGIQIISLRLAKEFAPIMRRWLWRKVLYKWIQNIPNSIEEMFVELYPLKSQQSIDHYMQHHAGNCVPLQFCTYKHHWEARELAKGEMPELHVFASGRSVNGFS